MFKKGDVLICVNRERTYVSSVITIEKEYVVQRDGDAGCSVIIGDDGVQYGIFNTCFKLKEEIEFKKGDTVICVNNVEMKECPSKKELTVGKEYEVERITNQYDGNRVSVKNDEGKWQLYFPERFKLKEEVMNMKDRIEKLTGWDKDADDLLEELLNKTNLRLFVDNCGNNDGHFIIVTHGNILTQISKGEGLGLLKHKAEFKFNRDFCQKLRAFKDALLWLADKAGMLSLAGKEVKAEIEGKVYKVKVIKEC